MIGTVVGGYRITGALAEGTWNVYRGQGPTGEGAIITVASPPTPDDVIRQLELPFEGILPLRAIKATTEHERPASAVIEAEPRGYLIGDLKWPLPIDEVITVALDLARLLTRMHAAGVVHGSLRPQTTWIDTIDGRSTLTGTTPRPELAGLHTLSLTSMGTISPFVGDIFFPDVLARAEPRSVSSDVAQLGMMIYRMATRRSPFLDEPGEPAMQQLTRAIQGQIVPWPVGDARTRAIEELARDAIDPARAASRSLDRMLETLEKHARR